MNFASALSYPLDHSLILRKKKRIKREFLEKNKLVPIRIAVLGGSTTSALIDIIELFLLESGYKVTFYESDYARYYEDALFNIDALKEFGPNIVVIHTTSRNIARFPDHSTSEDDLKGTVKDELTRYSQMWESLSVLGCAIIQNNFDSLPLRTLGNMDGYALSGATHYINALNMELANHARSRNNLYVNDIHYLSAYIGLQKWHDEKLWNTAKYAMSMDSIVEVAFSLKKIALAIMGKSKKCLILDLDNTCWGGVIGDDGEEGIEIGLETASGESFYEFQQYIKSLQQRGVALAVSSKNDIENAKLGFSHPSSVLSYSDFTAFKANWEPKPKNILEIANDINIGTDALVFIDDNPSERHLVKSQIPDISVPDVGDDVTNFSRFIDHNGYFEAITLSDDDLKRSRQYSENSKRQKYQARYDNYEEYLRSLKMQAEIRPFSDVYIERIAQLTNKTNQFNLTTKRFTVSEIEDVANDTDHLTFYGKLSDCFGDNGLIAITVAEIRQETEAHIKLWLMSCRVLKRDMELAMLDSLVDECIDRGVKTIYGYYYKTTKNSMVKDMYKSFGFSLMKSTNEDSIWSLPLDNTYVHKNRLIEII